MFASFCLENVWLYTRARRAGARTLKRAYGTLASLGLAHLRLRRAGQRGCPKVVTADRRFVDIISIFKACVSKSWKLEGKRGHIRATFCTLFWILFLPSVTFLYLFATITETPIGKNHCNSKIIPDWNASNVQDGRGSGDHEHYDNNHGCADSLATNWNPADFHR